jgi:hypothetical protein
MTHFRKKIAKLIKAGNDQYSIMQKMIIKKIIKLDTQDMYYNY